MITPWKVPFISWAIRTAKVALLATVGLAISNAASAQRGFGHVSLSAPSAHVATGHTVGAPPVVMRLPVTPVARRIVIPQGTSATSTQTIQSSSLFNSASPAELVGLQTSLSQLLNPVPGLGFDYSNLAAINHDLGIRAIIDPVTQQELALSERLLQLTPTAPISSSFFASEPVVMLEQQPPQVIIVQQPQPPAEQANAEAPPSAAPVEVEQPPLPDVGQFVLALRDGTQIQAVAFTRQNDRIVYITTDGRRKSIAIGDLDTAATRRLNDERGTPLQLSF
ncbi:MAG TPA: hypothetical protein VKT50_13275 [Candidatus Acidoferrales bacterium]|nr:hypothetical protein [Candidatus Acidoferrales bacterium]